MLFGEGPQIKNIAADLNKLFRQGSLLNQSGQTVEGDSTADQGASDLLAARDPVIQEISVGMSGEQSARYTVSGTPPLSLPNSLGKPLKAWSVALSPYQDLHGQDSPWPAGGGVNRFDGAWESGSFNGTTGVESANPAFSRSVNFIAVLSNAAYYVYGSEITSTTEAFVFAYQDDGTYINYQKIEANGTYTTPSNCAKVCLQVRRTIETVANYLYAFNYPNTVTTYSPYANICPIHGTDKLTITTAGKNLFDKTDSIVNGYVEGSTGQFRSASGNPERSFITGLLAAGTYTISKVSTSRFRIGVYATIPTERTDCLQFATANPQTATSFTITTTQDAYWAIFAYNGSGETVTPQEIADSIQIEFGSTATPYTPYLAPSQTVITLPSTVYNGTVGSEGGESRWREVDLGTLEWTYYADADFMYTYPPDIKSGTRNALCEMFPWGGSTYQNPTFTVNGLILRVYSTGYTDSADFKTFVSGCKFVYETDTPTVFSVTAPTIPTPKGSATTWATAEDGTVDEMSVTYVGKA